LGLADSFPNPCLQFLPSKVRVGGCNDAAWRSIDHKKLGGFAAKRVVLGGLMLGARAVLSWEREKKPCKLYWRRRRGARVIFVLNVK